MTTVRCFRQYLRPKVVSAFGGHLCRGASSSANSSGSLLSHVDSQGRARMVDVGGKTVSAREAEAECVVRLPTAAVEQLAAGRLRKGDALATAELAGVMAAKRTAELLPLCHTLPLERVRVRADLCADESLVRVRATVGCTARTGVEMEALTAAAVAALTVYDMTKAVSQRIVVDGLRLVRKTGGKSHYDARHQSEPE